MTTFKRMLRAGLLSPEIVVALSVPSGGVIGGLIMFAIGGNPSVMIAALVVLAAMLGIAAGVCRLEPTCREILDRYAPPAARPGSPETGR